MPGYVSLGSAIGIGCTPRLLRAATPRPHVFVEKLGRAGGLLENRVYIPQSNPSPLFYEQELYLSNTGTLHANRKQTRTCLAFFNFLQNYSYRKTCLNMVARFG